MLPKSTYPRPEQCSVMVRTVFFHLNMNVSPKIRLTMQAAEMQLHLCICRQQIACLACNQLHKRARSNPKQHLTMIVTILLLHSHTLPERCDATPEEMRMIVNQHLACTHDMHCSYTHPRKEHCSQNFRTLFFHTNTFVNTMDDASWQVESEEALSYIKFSQQGHRSTWIRIDRLTVYESFCSAAMLSSLLLYRTCDYTCDIIDFLSKYHLSDVWYEERRKTVQVNGLPTTAAIIHNYIRVITRSGRPPVNINHAAQ